MNRDAQDGEDGQDGQDGEACQARGGPPFVRDTNLQMGDSLVMIVSCGETVFG